MFAPSFLRRSPLRRLSTYPWLLFLSQEHGLFFEVNFVTVGIVSPGFRPYFTGSFGIILLLFIVSIISYRFLWSFFFSVFHTSSLHYAINSPNREWEHVRALCVHGAHWTSDPVA